MTGLALAVRPGLVVVKYGGAVMGSPELARGWALDVARLVELGARLVVVHGGGPELTRTLARLGIDSRFVDGQRVTCAESARVAQMVLSGRINKEVVSLLAGSGLKAIGLSGVDGGLLTVRPHRPGGRDLGFVGEVAEVDPTPLRLLLDHGYLPVVSSTAADDQGQPYNINADLVAGAIAVATGAAQLVFLSDVAGVQVAGERVALLTASRARALLAGGEADGGMRPKLGAALEALAAGVPRVSLADGQRPHALLTEVLGEGSGTLLVADPTVGEPAAAGRPAPPQGGGSGAWSWEGSLAGRGAAALMSTYARYPIELAQGRGTRLRSAAGEEYLDFAAGIAVNLLGHRHPAVVAAIRAAADGLLHVSNLYWTEPMVRLAERLTAAAGMERAFFCNSGAEAVEAALKLARRTRPGRSKVVVFERSFHGRTLGALSATAQPHYQEPFRPLLDGFVVLPYGDFARAEAAIDADTACVLVEPIQGEGGIRPAPRGFLAHLRARCDRSASLLVYDEVQTGLGRTGTLYAWQGEGVAPDALASAKALAAGLPMGVLLARGAAATAFAPGDHASTFGGGPFVAAVANAVLDVVLAPGFLAEVAAKGTYLGASLHALAVSHPGLVKGFRGRGLMWGLALHQPRAPELVTELHRLGVLAVPAGKDVLRLVPPLTITRAEIAEGVARIDRALGRLQPHGTAAGGEERARCFGSGPGTSLPRAASA